MKIFKSTVKLFILTTLMATGAQAQPVTMTGSKGLRECASCHFQWIEAFQSNLSKLLVKKPDKPMEAESLMCLSCHDGSVVDSRRRVYLEHGHEKDVVPPPDMEIPDILPLKDGKIVCRTCHTAHIGGAPVNLDNPVFLRMKNEKSQLCLACHKNKTPTDGMHDNHPLGKLNGDIPEVLVKAGAKISEENPQIHCETCHTPHGAKQNHLLVLRAEDNDLCLACHNEKRPGMWHEKQPGAHPDRPIIHAAEQIQAIESMGTRLGDESRLICLSCHKMHNGQSGNFMLAMSLEDSKFCTQCHPNKNDILNSSHDPRKYAMDSKNDQGLTIEQAGPCSACHMFHSLAHKPASTTDDTTGMCNSCHNPAGLAAKTGKKHGQLTHTHPLNVPVKNMSKNSDLPLYHSNATGEKEVMTCQTCHNLHKPAGNKCLRTSPNDLCQSCHADLADQMANNPHDLMAVNKQFNANDQIDSGCSSCHKRIHRPEKMTDTKMTQCGLCHQMHAWDDDQNLWAFIPDATGAISDEQICTSCHNDITWDPNNIAPSKKAVLHPRSDISQIKNYKPLKIGTKPKELMACQTCHDPHNNSDKPHLLRVDSKASADELCYQCHQDIKMLQNSMHNQLALEGKYKAGICAPCHTIHATTTSVSDKLWNAPQDPTSQMIAEKRCLGCHGPYGKAKKPNMFNHPKADLLPGALQYWVGQGEQKSNAIPTSNISCVTCHNAHGHFDSDEKTVADKPKNITAIAAKKPMLRKETATTLCAYCHNTKAGNFFLYWHQPSKRK
ncbi:MAG: hypothetical protein K9M57_01980 [Phycisphaerae bacterium]|nr:hypothetical protein [Phycisphaerae bacterium]